MSSETPSVSDETIHEMVELIEPEWRVATTERSAHGTEFVTVLEVRTPEGSLQAVLKATTADLVDPIVARSEPRFLTLIGQETSIPVPTVYGYRDVHPDLPAPFLLMSYEEGRNFENEIDQLSPEARETVLREAGKHLADLHDLGPLPGYGKIGVQNGELTVLDTDEHPRHADFRDKLLGDVGDTLDSLAHGGFFPNLADEPDRFADLIPPLRAYLSQAIPDLPEPGPPRYNYWDYRYGNLLLDPETGEAQAVLDWANLSVADPAYNLTKVEENLLTPEHDCDARTTTLREIFRGAYTEARDGWEFDAATRERMHVYRLTARLDAMACLPLWYQDAPPEKRDERAAEHRTFVSRYL